jgi:hypothetical protein
VRPYWKGYLKLCFGLLSDCLTRALELEHELPAAVRDFVERVRA